MEKKREDIPYLHALRVIAILCVILLHSMNPYITDVGIFGTRTWFGMLFLNSIARAGVPLFFMISGFLHLSSESTLDIKGFYTKRLGGIVIPLFSWSVIYYTLEAINGGSLDILSFFSKFFNAHGGGVEYHFWFLYTLFGFYLLMPFLKRITDSLSRGGLWVFLCVISFFTAVMPVIHLTTPLFVYFFDPLLNGYAGFFIFGYILGTADTEKRYTVPLAVLSLVLGISITFFGNHFYSSETAIDLVFNGGFYLNHYLTAGGIFILLKKLWRLKDGIICSFTKVLSRSSFSMYFVHVFVMNEFFRRLSEDVSPAMGVVISFAFVSLVSAALGVILTRIRPLKGILY